MYEEKKKKTVFLCKEKIKEGFFFENLCTKRLIKRPHFLAPCGIEMNIKSFLKS